VMKSGRKRRLLRSLREACIGERVFFAVDERSAV